MSLTISHVSFVADRPIVTLANSGRIRVRLGEDTTFSIEPDDARTMCQDIEAALIRLAFREENHESPLAK